MRTAATPPQNPIKTTPDGKVATERQVLSTAPIVEHDMSQPIPGAVPPDADAAARAAVNVVEAAPVVADARTRNLTPDEQREEAELVASSALVWARVEADANINDNGSRVKLRAGKEISTKDYDFRSLLRQGVKLKKIDGPSTGRPFTADMLS